MLHTVVEKGVYSGSVAYSCGKGGIFWEGGVDTRRVAYSRKGRFILGGRGTFWDPKIPHIITKKGVDPGRGQLLGTARIYPGVDSENLPGIVSRGV